VAKPISEDSNQQKGAEAMTIFSVEFRTDAGSAAKELKAKTAEAALARARRVASRDADSLCFQPYESEAAINEIVVANEDGEELAVWRDEDVPLRLAARDLLDAARAVIARWEKGDLAEAARELAAAIAKAEGAE
jgi:hypothetical protein